MSDARPDSPLLSDAANGLRFAVVVSRFNEVITDRLRQGALACLLDHGASPADIITVWVPGAFELPMAASQLASTSRFDAIVCLGALIRGETSHYEVLAYSTAAGIQDVALRNGLPVTFGLLTCDTAEQAAARAGGEHGNKGIAAAAAAIEMAVLFAAGSKR
jgi:6,7-dimethyl-8-ribityllumazine synthase